jgi:hypothetical protein
MECTSPIPSATTATARPESLTKGLTWIKAAAKRRALNDGLTLLEEYGQMSNGEMLYLALALGAALVFAVVLAWASQRAK